MSEGHSSEPDVTTPARVAPSDRLGRWLLGPLALVLLVIVLVFYVFFTPQVVDGDSMLPTLHDGDRTLTTRGYERPARGDIVVFRVRNNGTGGNNGTGDEYLIKRVVAVPGDVIEVRRGVTTVNGRREDTSRYYEDPHDRLVIGPVTVPTGMLFVLGDNREVALDSRRLGFIPLDAVEGEVRLVYAPVNRVRVLP